MAKPASGLPVTGGAGYLAAIGGGWLLAGVALCAAAAWLRRRSAQA